MTSYYLHSLCRTFGCQFAWFPEGERCIYCGKPSSTAAGKSVPVPHLIPLVAQSNIKQTICGRDVAFAALVGSHNYHLDTPQSDKDYKYFVLPTLDDLYDAVIFAQGTVASDVDYTVHDIRELPQLLYKANINFLEVLFSTEAKFSFEFQTDCDWLFRAKEEIARMNLPKLYEACTKMAERKVGLAHKYPLRFGKEMHHAIRLLDFLGRYAGNGFSSFNLAIWYDKGTLRDTLINCKTTCRNKEQFLQMYEDFRLNAEKLRPCYLEQAVNHETYDKLKKTIKRFVLSQTTRSVVT